MPRRLDGRAVLTTGAGSGIGRATVLRVAAWDSVLAVNLTGTVRTVVASLPYVADGASNSELRDDNPTQSC